MGGGSFYESDVIGGNGPDGSTGAATEYGLSYWFVGLSDTGHSVWAPRFGDHHRFQQADEVSILAAIAAVNGVWYLEVYPADARTGECAVYEAGAPGWPAPGPNYVRVGTSGTSGIPDYSLGAGLPLYARVGADPKLIRLILFMVGG